MTLNRDKFEFSENFAGFRTFCEATIAKRMKMATEFMKSTECTFQHYKLFIALIRRRFLR